ncbi:exocyst complex protein exo70 [Patellaria atrata CBS 101060]|uniref:Exocyst complex protein EXO70 n=1 Tax=Patellaria atrata CBS 101060 TaxID=1346257 RepID=A0A9P4VV23_9PEZI|nr:exocyst complex protein exo70 [Patellaria atrata CBS 101060]
MVAPRTSSLVEDSAEVEILYSDLEKLKNLTKRIQGSMNRLETSGNAVAEAIGPIYGNTQRLQVMNSNVDRMLEAIDRIREPLDQRNREERIIRSGPRKTGLTDYIASLDRTTQALGDLKHSNLRSNQQAIGELNALIRLGTSQLEDVFKDILLDDVRPVEPLHYVTKALPFPAIPQEKSSRLRLINTHISASVATMSQSDVRDTPTARIYADIRGEYMAKSLRNSAVATVSTARKTTADAIYRQGTNGIGTYAQAMEGLFVAEYGNICPVFARDEWGRVYNFTCQSSLTEFSKTLRELNTHIKNNLMTDCFLGYEVMDIVSNLSISVESRTGELKRTIADCVQPIRETSKASLPKLLEDTRSRVQSLVALPIDGGSIPVTADIMTRLQTMTSYLAPLSSLMTSLGDGGWSTAPSSSSSTSLPSLRSFDVGADGKQLFEHYAIDTLDTLLSNLESKARALLKSRQLQGVFIANNVAIIERMIRNSDLGDLLGGAVIKLESWRKKSVSMYNEAWREPSTYLLDVQYTNRGGRPHSGGGSIDSAAVVKGLASKDKEAIKEKFKNFNMSFDDLVAKHKSFKMEREVRVMLAREIQAFIEPLYGRFWDRYHEIDKGKGKYVKYDKKELGSVLSGLA